MDGVIVDSMPYHFIAWYEALRPFGIRVSCFDVYSKEGERWEKTLIDLLKRAKLKPTKAVLKKIFLERQRIFKSYFKRFIFQGVEAAIRCLKKRGYLLGLVTGTPQEEIKKILPLHLRGLFDCIVGGDEVKNGKPHPEPYLRAAKHLKVRPFDCMVIENAPLGITSAKKAGMFCVALTTSLPKEYLKAADIIIDSLDELNGIVEKACVSSRAL